MKGKHFQVKTLKAGMACQKPYLSSGLIGECLSQWLCLHSWQHDDRCPISSSRVSMTPSRKCDRNCSTSFLLFEVHSFSVGNSLYWTKLQLQITLNTPTLQDLFSDCSFIMTKKFLNTKKAIAPRSSKNIIYSCMIMHGCTIDLLRIICGQSLCV